VTPTKASQIIEMPTPSHLPGQSEVSPVFEAIDIIMSNSHITAPSKPVIRE
jgi:hypothetical protein